MNSKTDQVVPLVVLAERLNKRGSVQSRVERKREVLALWIRDGVPPEKLESLPSSLTEARKWEDPELGVWAIKSPNDFLLAHEVWGVDVKAIQKHLTFLKGRYKRTRRPSKSSEAPSNRAELLELNDAIQKMASQWSTEREMRLQEAARADSAEMRAAILLKENTANQAEIADLRRQLSRLQGLRIIE